MLKHAFLVYLSSLLMYSTAYSQRETANFDDGTSMDYEILDTNPDMINKINIFYLKGLGVDYYMPKLGVISGKYFPRRYGVEGMIFFHSKEKKKEENLILKSVGGYFTTHYYVKKSLPSRISWGLHSGYYKLDYSKSKFIIKEEIGTSDFKANELFIGIGRQKISYHSFIRHDGDRSRMNISSSEKRFCLDLIYFQDRNGGGVNELDSTKRNYGFRIYSERKGNFLNKVDLGLKYRYGLQIGPNQLITNDLFDLVFDAVILEFGIYFGF